MTRSEWFYLLACLCTQSFLQAAPSEPLECRLRIDELSTVFPGAALHGKPTAENNYYISMRYDNCKDKDKPGISSYSMIVVKLSGPNGRPKQIAYFDLQQRSPTMLKPKATFKSKRTTFSEIHKHAVIGQESDVLTKTHGLIVNWLECDSRTAVMKMEANLRFHRHNDDQSLTLFFLIHYKKTDKELHEEMEDFPSLPGALAAVSSMREREERALRIFAPSVDREQAAHCLCQSCPPRDTQEAEEYCCASLFSTLPLLKKGQILRDGLKGKMDPTASHSCICKDPFVFGYLLTEDVARAASVTFTMLTGVVIEDQHKALRYGAYRLFVAESMGVLGRGQRVRLPSCFVQAVRLRWPSPTYGRFEFSDV